MEIENTIMASYMDENQDELGTMTLDYDSDSTVEELYAIALTNCQDKLRSEDKKITGVWIDKDGAHCTYLNGNKDIEVTVSLYLDKDYQDLIPASEDKIGDELMTHNGVYWYAHEVDENDNDWGDGTFDKVEAMARLKEEGGQIAVIEGGPDPECVEIIRPEDI